METAKVTDLKLPESKFLCKRGRCSIMNRIEDLVARLQKREEEKIKIQFYGFSQLLELYL